MIDGWQRLCHGRLTTVTSTCGRCPALPTSMRRCGRSPAGFSTSSPNSWVTHVSGPAEVPLLTFVWLDRIEAARWRLGGAGVPAGGISAAAAVLIAVRVLASEQMARRTAPFVASGADGDGSRFRPTGISPCGGVGYRPVGGGGAWCHSLPGAGGGRSRATARLVSFSTGLVLIVLPGMAVCTPPLAARPAGTGGRPCWRLVVAVIRGCGFSWFVVIPLSSNAIGGDRQDRPFGWSWANLACVVCAIGLGSVAGLNRVFRPGRDQSSIGCHLLLLPVLAAIALADLGMLSKAETRRSGCPSPFG